MKKISDISGFPVITSSLHFTSSESKWARNPFVTVWVPLALSWNLVGCSYVLSPGLCIHHHRSRGCHSDLLKVPKDKRRFRSPHRVRFLWHENVESSRNVLLSFTALFKKHTNSEVQKLPSQLHFSLPSIIITITSNEPLNTEIHKMNQNPQITNYDLLNPLE